MTTDSARKAALAERKAQLILDGALLRIGIVQAKTMLAHDLRADNLVRGVLAHACRFAGSTLWPALRMQSQAGRLHALVPLALAAASWLSRRKPAVPAAGTGLAVVAAAAAAGAATVAILSARTGPRPP